MIGRRVEWCGFAGQRRSTHLVTAAIGVAVFAGAYLGWSAVETGTVATIVDGGPTGTAIRRRSLTAGAIACWTYFALATMAARGGPLVNTVFYPGAIVALGPPLVHLTAFGAVQPGVASSAPVLSGRWAAETVSAVLPGMVAGAALLGGWFYGRLDADGRRRWIRQNLPEAFREEFIDAPRRTLDRRTPGTIDDDRGEADCRDR